LKKENVNEKTIHMWRNPSTSVPPTPKNNQHQKTQILSTVSQIPHFNGNSFFYMVMYKAVNYLKTVKKREDHYEA